MIAKLVPRIRRTHRFIEIREMPSQQTRMLLDTYPGKFGCVSRAANRINKLLLTFCSPELLYQTNGNNGQGPRLCR